MAEIMWRIKPFKTSVMSRGMIMWFPPWSGFWALGSGVQLPLNENDKLNYLTVYQTKKFRNFWKIGKLEKNLKIYSPEIHPLIQIENFGFVFFELEITSTNENARLFGRLFMRRSLTLTTSVPNSSNGVKN